MCERSRPREEVCEPLRPDVFFGDLAVRRSTEAACVRHQWRVRRRCDKWPLNIWARGPPSTWPSHLLLRAPAVFDFTNQHSEPFGCFCQIRRVRRFNAMNQLIPPMPESIQLVEHFRVKQLLTRQDANRYRHGQGSLLEALR